jgi:protein SCO1/2
MRTALVAGLVLGLAGPLLAQGGPGLMPPAPGQNAAVKPEVFKEIGFDQKLGAALPLDTVFRDEKGESVPLRRYFGGKPVVLQLAYYDCPMLCTVTISGLATALGLLTLEPGRDFEVLTVSFDPKDTPTIAAQKKANYLAKYQRSGAQEGWHFLTGDAAAIKTLTDAVGFRYSWNEATRQFAHPAGLLVATPEGKISHYLFGIEYAPRDLRLALVESSAGKVGSPVDQVLLYCYQYDPTTGRYGAAIMRVVRIGGLLTLLALGSFLVVNWRRDLAQARAQASASGRSS